MCSVFEEVDIFSSEEVGGYANVIFVAHGPDVRIDWPAGPYEPRGSFLDKRPVRTLTDSRSPVLLWNAAIEQRWREESKMILAGGE